MLRIILYKNTELQSEWDVVKGCNSYIRGVFKMRAKVSCELCSPLKTRWKNSPQKIDNSNTENITWRLTSVTAYLTPTST